MPRFNPSTLYKLPKDIGEIALRLMKDGTNPATALGTARMLSSNPQDPQATAFVSDLMRRSQMADARAEDAIYESPMYLDDQSRTLRDLRNVYTKLSLGNSLRAPAGLERESLGMGGANRRIYAEAALSASEGNAKVFRQSLLDMGFDSRVVDDLVRRYTPTIIRQEPDAMGML